MNPDHAVYRFSLRLTQPDESRLWLDGHSSYTSFEKCLEAAKRFATHYDEHWMKHVEIRINRKELDSSEENVDHIDVFLDSNYEISGVFDAGCPADEFEMDYTFLA